MLADGAMAMHWANQKLLVGYSFSRTLSFCRRGFILMGSRFSVPIFDSCHPCGCDLLLIGGLYWSRMVGWDLERWHVHLRSSSSRVNRADFHVHFKQIKEISLKPGFHYYQSSIASGQDLIDSLTRDLHLFGAISLHPVIDLLTPSMT